MVKTGKEKGKKSAAQRKKKSAGPDIPWKEALLAYDITLKEKALEQNRFQVKQFEEQNARFKTRNQQLKEDQEVAINQLLRTSREFEKLQRERDVVSKDQVIAQMMHNWELKKANDQHLADLEQQLANIGEQISKEDSELSYWKQFRDMGQHDNDKTIRLLEQELVDMEASFTDISNHLQLTLERAKDDIEKTTSEILSQQKHIATEKAIARMDRYGRREVIDNEWLMRETEIHRKEVAELFHTVEKLEDENVKILSELFECQVEDLHISRNFFMTQFVDNENLSKNTLLEIDMAEMTRPHLTGAHQSCESDASRSTPRGEQSRPKSAVYQAVEDKMFLLDQLHGARHSEDTQEAAARHEEEDGRSLDEDDEELDEDEDEDEQEQQDQPAPPRVEYDSSSHYDGSLGAPDIDPFLEFHHFDDEDFEDFLHLGPLELKLLNVTGKQVSTHKPASPDDDVRKMQQVRPDDWPVTVAMLHRTLRQTPRAAGDDAS